MYYVTAPPREQELIFRQCKRKVKGEHDAFQNKSSLTEHFMENLLQQVTSVYSDKCEAS